jgi:hypothetical protein
VISEHTDPYEGGYGPGRCDGAVIDECLHGLPFELLEVRHEESGVVPGNRLVQLLHLGVFMYPLLYQCREHLGLLLVLVRVDGAQ